MKRTIAALFSFIVMLAASQIVRAQDTRISLSYGVPTAMRNINVYHDVDGLHGNPWGAVNLSVDHQFYDRLWFGLSYTLSTAPSRGNGHTGRSSSIVWHGLMAGVNYEWGHYGALTLYSHASAGVIVCYYSPSWQDSYNRTRGAFQLSPIAMDYAVTPSVSLFAEAGYGIQGALQVGARVRF